MKVSTSTVAQPAQDVPDVVYVGTMTSPLALPRNQRCLILRILHPTILSMISPNLPTMTQECTEKQRRHQQCVIFIFSASHSATTASQESSDKPESFKVRLEDPVWKVLPAALKEYRTDNDDWQTYVMFICYGPPSTSL